MKFMTPKLYVERNKTLYSDTDCDFSKMIDIIDVIYYMIYSNKIDTDKLFGIKINELEVKYYELETNEEYKKRIMKENRTNTKRNITKLKLKEIGITKSLE